MHNTGGSGDSKSSADGNKNNAIEGEEQNMFTFSALSYLQARKRWLLCKFTVV